MRVLGLMSGTSADGVDAVLAEFHGPPRRPRWRLLASAALPYPEELRQRLVALGQGQPVVAAELLDLAEALTEHQAAAARLCDPEGRAELIGCHGQTVWHRPPQQHAEPDQPSDLHQHRPQPAQADTQQPSPPAPHPPQPSQQPDSPQPSPPVPLQPPQRRGASWQLLQGPLLAQLLERPVVFDFRANDLALGGQGAPLVPATDAALLGGIGGWRALLNLGGIANLTLLPPGCGPERRREVLGWDCGPANTLLDLAVQRFSGGALQFDAEGAWARQGRCEEALLRQWLREAYFQQPPPKSTGRELFGMADLERRLADLGEAQAAEALETPEAIQQRQADALATLTAFAAAVVAQDLERGVKPLDLLVAGGGARNRLLMEQLRRRCRGIRVRPLAELGIGDSEREPLAFALLAWWRWRRHPGSLPSVTGARRAALLGVVADPA